MKAYCVHCHKTSTVTGGKKHKASNGREYMQGSCSTCRGKVTKFV